jgi:hypothetical protein
MDDTHGDYYNKEEILYYKGPIAEHFADPSLGLVKGEDAAGAERGDDKYSDTYFFLFFNVNYRPALYSHHSYHHFHRRLKFK